MFQSTLRKVRFQNFLTLFGLCFFFSQGCREAVDLQKLRADQVNWATYSNAKVGYSLKYPTALTLEEYAEGSVAFRNGWDGVPILVRYTNEQDGKNRDIWFGHEPVGKIMLAGREGNKFIYTHHDGPFGTRTISYVVEHKGKFLGLEFRTPNELNEIQQRVLSSCKFNE